MTLQDLCRATTNDFMVTVTQDGNVVATFLRSTYESIVTTYLEATVSTVTFKTNALKETSMEVVIE